MQRSISGLLWPVIVICATVSAWLLVHGRADREPDPRPRPSAAEKTRRKDQDQFYTSEVKPLLTDARKDNRRAVSELVNRINAIFANYSRGIRPFAEDVTSIGTRLAVLGRMPGDWWYDDQDLRSYIRGKFEKHIFSRNELRRDITIALRAFREKLVANRNRLFSRVRAAAQTSQVRIPHLPDLTDYEKQVRNLIVRSSSKAARESVYNGIATLVVSETGAVLLEKLVARALASAGTGAALSAATSGSATTGGAAAGGSTGTLAGPAGTAIGVGVGLVVGIAIDWWMTERFQDRLDHRLTRYLNNLKGDLLYGTADQPGLRQVAEEFTKRLNSAEKQALRRCIMGADS